MALTPAQLPTLKTDLSTNTNEINGVQIKDLPHTADNALAVAAWYNTINSPDYWVWKTNVSRLEIYDNVSSNGTSWDWTVYKNQSATEQNAWVQMFMGDIANFGLVNKRAGIGKIFTGSAQASAQRDHVLASGRRKANRVEKLFAVAVVDPPANSGNNSADARGASTNPDVIVLQGNISSNDVDNAWNLPA